MPFAQLVFGPPGSGKTTYCLGMGQFLEGLGRSPVLVNLDPANERVPYEAGVDLCQLITLHAAMRDELLGPNGSFLYCMEYLEVNVDWLREQLERRGVFRDAFAYCVFDCPGQVELYTHHPSLRRILGVMQKEWGFHFCGVNLVDSLCCRDPHQFLSAALVSLCTMLQLELPHVNVLTKVDLLQRHAEDMVFDLDFYSQVQDLSSLIERMQDQDREEGNPRYTRLSAAIAEVVEDFSLVFFHPLHVEDKELMTAVLESVDKANGWAFSGRAPARPEIGGNAMKSLQAMSAEVTRKAVSE